MRLYENKSDKLAAHKRLNIESAIRQEERKVARQEGRRDETNSSARINNSSGWDTQGRHHTPAGGGNLWRSDGSFMQKAAGGYIDTKTGQFVPSQ